ncbi:MAG: urea ABC transporter permease subunit UrtC [Burkholderiaceae bacterium]
MNRSKRNGAIGGMALLALVILVVFPATLDIFRLNMVGKYLTYAFVAIGLVMLWGWGGILSLGQGIFFGLGGYAMAMFLKLEASDPEATKIQSTPGIPDFMDWNQLTELPTWWVPFKHLPFALIAVVAVPVALAFVIGFAMFKRRVSGVYFAIITQAVALILTVLIIGQQGYTGGVNGITDLKTLLGWDIRTDSAKYVLYFVNAALLLVSIALCWWVQSSKLGTLLLAMRDKENRVRFSGYDVGMFQIFAFCLAAGLAGVGGAMFTLQVGFMSPSFVGIVPSIEMVIFAAVGGRMSLVGAVYGTLLVNFGKTYFSESFPDLWLFLMAALFIGVVLAFPDGLAGVYQKYVAPRLFGRDASRASKAAAAAAAMTAAGESGALDPGKPAGAAAIGTGGIGNGGNGAAGNGAGSSGAAGNGAGGGGAGGNGAGGNGVAGGGALGNGAVGNGGPRVHGQGA